VTRVLDPQLEWRFSVEHDDVALRKRRVQIVDGSEVKVVEH